MRLDRRCALSLGVKVPPPGLQLFGLAALKTAAAPAAGDTAQWSEDRYSPSHSLGTCCQSSSPSPIPKHFPAMSTARLVE